MQLGGLLDSVRAQYLARFCNAVQELHGKKGVRILTELALRDAKGRAVCEGELDLPMRLDAVVLAEGREPQTVYVDSTELISFDAITFEWNAKLRVTIAPFYWDSLVLRLPHSPNKGDYGPIKAWYAKWFRDHEDGTGEPLGLVHFLSDPTPFPGGVSLQSDLGTAPVEAFEELLDAITALSVRSVSLGHGQ